MTTREVELLEALKQMVAVLENVATEHPEDLWLGSEYQWAKEIIIKVEGDNQ